MTTWIRELASGEWDSEHTRTVRICEDYPRRITEQGLVRIIERYAVHWDNEAEPVSPWTILEVTPHAA